MINNKMDLINKIVWWIPFKKLRDKTRNKLIEKYINPIIELLHFHLTDHCNLNCYGCSTYSQLAKESYYDINIFENDIKKIFDITKGRIKMIFLIGGEPLLHPNINEFSILTRKYFKDSFIAIFTNGILLNKQNDDFWKTCKENNISIIMTKYPINMDFNLIENICKDKGISFSYTASTENEIKTSCNMSFNLEGNEDIEYSFKNCPNSACYHIYNNKFYMCDPMAFIDHFNSYFNLNLKITEKDYLKLDKTSLRDLKKYISNPIPFCRYCHRPINVVGTWRPSKKVIEEYLYIQEKK